LATRSIRLLCTACLLAGYAALWGQTTAVNRDGFKLKARKTEQPIRIDGFLDETIWGESDTTGPFYRILPIDTGYAQAQTQVMITYDESNFYLGIICHDTLPGKRPVESFRRDWNFGKNDNFFAAIDTYNDQTNGFAFGVNAVGGQWDGSQSDGGIVANEWLFRITRISGEPSFGSHSKLCVIRTG
jgi:hypothetical protein